MLGYINYNVKIPFWDKLNADFQNLCLETEEADKEDNLAIYLNNVDAIDKGAKILCMNGHLSSYEWDLLMTRYTW